MEVNIVNINQVEHELDLSTDLSKRSYKILKFISTLLSILGSVGIGIYIFSILTSPEKITIVHYAYFALTTLISSFFFYVRFRGINRNLKLSYYIIFFVLLIPALLIPILGGTTEGSHYVIAAVLITMGGVIYGEKIVWRIWLLFSILLIIINLLHNLNFIAYTPTTTSSNPFNTVMYLLLLGILSQVIIIGFNQINHAYQKAYEYNKELVKLNRQLDKKVKLRTRQLKKSYDEKVDLIHNAAIVGSITQPLIHDLSTPISTLDGLLMTYIRRGEYSISKEEGEIAYEAIKQLKRIIIEGKNLMNSRSEVTVFSPEKVVDTVLFILKSKLNKHNIKTEKKFEKGIKIKGIENIFERIVINLVLNSMEELENLDKKKAINLRGLKKNGKFLFEVEDTGRGISRADIKQIFEPGYTTKSRKLHVGMGLSFVKDILEKKFKGEIEVKSEQNIGTKFIVKIPLYDEENT